MSTIKSTKEIAVITIHGMGRADQNYYKGFEKRLQKKLGTKWDQVAFGHIYYQDILDNNEVQVYKKMKKAKTPFATLAWSWIREFLIFFLADPASLENGKSDKESSYYLTQEKIATELQSIYDQLGRDKQKKILVIAHSLGAHVISSYIWDASYSQYLGHDIPEAKKTHVGIWGSTKYVTEHQLDKDQDEIEFLSLKNLYRFYTCGCNIPLFVAGHSYIAPIKQPNPDFEWLNFYNKNDVFGWPLQPLEGSKAAKDPEYMDHPTYNELVQDSEIPAGNWWQFWNPFSHLGYWTDDHFIDPIAKELKSLIP